MLSMARIGGVIRTRQPNKEIEMICYKDMTFCCSKNCTCSRKIEDWQIKEAEMLGLEVCYTDFCGDIIPGLELEKVEKVVGSIEKGGYVPLPDLGKQ